MEGEKSMDPAPGREIKSVRELLCDWREKARHNQVVHYAKADQLTTNSYRFSYSLAGLSALIGCLILLSIRIDVYEELKLWIGVFSIVAATLSGVHASLKLAERAGLHHAAAAKYGAARRHIEAVLALPPEPPEQATKTLAAIREVLDSIPSTAPAITRAFWFTTPKDLTP
jgi:hypothetical protein